MMIINPFVFAPASVGEISFVGSGGMTTLAPPTTYNFSSLRDESNAAPTLLEDDLVIVIQFDIGTTNCNILPPTGYTQAFEAEFGSSSLAAFYKFMGPSPDSSVEILEPSGDSGNWEAATVYAFRGVDLSTPIDAAATSTSSGSGAVNAPSYTPVTPGALVIACGGIWSTTPMTNPSGWSATTNHFRNYVLSATADPNIATALLLDWQSGAVDPPAFGGPSGSWMAATFALRPA